MLLLQKLGANVWTFSLEPTQSQNLFSSLFPNPSASSSLWHHQIGNINDLNALQNLVEECKPQVVIHLAAQPLVRLSYTEPIETWRTNVMGSLNLLEALRSVETTCAVVMITTDKVYQNFEWPFGYRESDPLGGHDPYSASKAAAEIAISSWRSSFCGFSDHQNPYLRIATARAGNVIGGGDWSTDRILPDSIKSLSANLPIELRNPHSTRPWQHVLEPLFGYLLLAQALTNKNPAPCEPFNFGPAISSNRTVEELANMIVSFWPGEINISSPQSSPHEANLLHLQIDKAYHSLGWQPYWDFTTTVQKTVEWYKSHRNGASALSCCMSDIYSYFSALNLQIPL